MIQPAAGWLGLGRLPWDGESTTEFNKPEAGNWSTAREEHHHAGRLSSSENASLTEWLPSDPRQGSCWGEYMRNITVLTGRHGVSASVRETEDPRAWDLEWTGTPDPPQARRMLRNAETAILKNGGELVIITCPGDQEAMRETLDRCRGSTASPPGDRYRLELMAPGEDGFVHDDNDFRTPLHRITCPTCVERIAKRRTKNRQGAFGKGNGPKEIARRTRLVAEAYARLADMEENLRV